MRSVLFYISVILLGINCRGASDEGIVIGEESLLSYVFRYTPGNDLGPSVKHVIVLKQRVAHCTRSRIGPDGDSDEYPDCRISEIQNRRIVTQIREIPPGYWNRKIGYGASEDGGLVYRAWCSTIEIEEYRRGELIRRIEVDGFDNRLRTIFMAVLACLPDKLRFDIEEVVYAVGDAEARGAFKWTILKQHENPTSPTSR